VTTKLQLPMLDKKAEVTVYADDAALNGSVKQQRLRSGSINITIPKNGGLVIVADI